ncbi:unnamed protein product [Leptidea sinapis]|uniref:Protein farnesyltransferase subunit beta n=1 Tax=Leptidea sinapis TaxID=189913 RepID=A0A5E4Q340_9NEOP|nr:unnamed protein product [Leptidea sinapis]
MENPIRSYSVIQKAIFDDEGVATNSSSEQAEVETIIKKIYRHFDCLVYQDPNLPKLNKKVHSKILKSWLKQLPVNYSCLDASRPWLVYWILHALWLLNDMPDSEILSSIVNFLAHCQNKDGGYGGGPTQYSHLGTTYAAVNALCIIGTKEAYDSINRSTLQKFLLSVKESDGSFSLHKGGEQDIRGAYCAISVAKLTNIYTDLLFDKTTEWIVSCQTYEGGFSGCPGMEAHGGYAFCGISSLALLNKTKLCDIDALLRWCVNRQMRLEGGFQGRTNKLVDGCYSFWQGAVFPIGCLTGIHYSLLFRDIYHTCYTLSGLSVAQHGTGMDDVFVIGTQSNQINKVHPLHNIAPHMAYNAIEYFLRQPIPNIDMN